MGKTKLRQLGLQCDLISGQFPQVLTEFVLFGLVCVCWGCVLRCLGHLFPQVRNVFVEVHAAGGWAGASNE